MIQRKVSKAGCHLILPCLLQQLEMRAEYGSARAYYQQALTASGKVCFGQCLLIC